MLDLLFYGIAAWENKAVAADADVLWLEARGISQPTLLKSFVGGKCCGLPPIRVMGGSPCPEQLTHPRARVGV